MKAHLGSIAATDFCNHQGLENQLLTTPPTAATPASDSSPVARRERLGGLLNFYYRRAA